MADKLREFGFTYPADRPPRRPGRPHFAKALPKRALDRRRFTALPRPGTPTYVARSRPTVNEAIDVIHRRGRPRRLGAPVLGRRPGRADAARVQRHGLDGVEAFYVTHTEEQTRHLHALAQELGLITTGSTDFHGPAHARFNRFPGVLASRSATASGRAQRVERDTCPTTPSPHWSPTSPATGVHPDEQVSLADLDTADTDDMEPEDARRELENLNERIADLQARLYAEEERAVLVVLQGIDAAGKDSSVKHVFRGTNPQGVRVYTFKEPTPEEASHDFLWRYHQDAPAFGMIHVFNRSHYEDVLVVRVKELIEEKRWRSRYRLTDCCESSAY